jgi:hypothetical protein
MKKDVDTAAERCDYARMNRTQTTEGGKMNAGLTWAERELGMASDSLRLALSRSTPVEALVLYPVIKAVADARNTVIVLRNAMEGVRP